MSSTLHVASHENPYVAECLRLGILAARQRPRSEDDLDLKTIEQVCIPLMQKLADSSTGGVSYVEIPKSEVCHQYEADDDNFCSICRKLKENHDYNVMTDTYWGFT